MSRPRSGRGPHARDGHPRTPGPGALLLLYPRTWRGRYGDELDALILDMHADGRPIGWRMRADLLRGALRARLEAALAGLNVGGSGDPDARVRGGASLVLWAWALFVLGGLLVAKASEHWQGAAGARGAAVAHGAFTALTDIAVATSGLVALAIALTLPAAARALREGDWPRVRPRALLAAALAVAWVPATAGLITWAHHLGTAARNGGDARYTAAFAVWVVLGAACLLAWTALATRVLRVAHCRPALLRAHAIAAPVVALAMAAMTAATVLWWAIVAARAPGALTGAHGSPVVPQLALAGALMVVATLMAGVGATRARLARPAD